MKKMPEKNEKKHYKKGLIHYIYGNGNGKSTSAFGITLRSHGHGFKPIIIQFLKKSQTESEHNSEINELNKIDIDISDLIKKSIQESNKETPPKTKKWYVYGEYKTLSEILKIPMIQLGTPSFIFTNQKPPEEDVKKSEFGLKLIERLMQSHYDLIVLDEIITATYLKIINVDELIKILKNKKENIEVILTGREKIDKLTEISDYITQVKTEKHPYEKGIKAREGVEY